MKLKSLVIAMSLFAAGTAMAGSAGADAGQQSAAAGMGVDYDYYVNQFNHLIDHNDNSYRGMDYSNIDWTKVFSVDGAIYIDSRMGDTDEGFTGENDSRYSVTNAYIGFNATPNDWVKAHVTMNYTDASAEYDPLSNDEFFVDQAYVTIANFDKYPVFVQGGLMFAPFGRYDIYPVVKPMTQVLSEVGNKPMAEVGFISDQGLFANAFFFENDDFKGDSLATSDAKTNGGVQVGYQRSMDRVSVDLGVGYLDDMAGVDAVEAYIKDNNNNWYQNSVSAYSGYATVKSGPFGLNVDYVTATDNYEASVIPGKTSSSNGAKPRATGVNATYDFMIQQLKSQAVVGYEESSEANAIGLPEKRYELGYNAYPVENLMVGVMATRDTAYGSDYVDNSGDVGTGDNYYTYSLRVGVKF